MATKTFPVAQAFSELPYTAIPLVPVESHQVAAIGYDAETKTLAVRFVHGAGHIYHYPNCEAQVHADFMAAESKGKFFGEFIKPMAFEKFHVSVTVAA